MSARKSAPVRQEPGHVASMSGYGRAEVSGKGLRVACEIRTVNHRHLDLSLSLPPALLAADPDFRRILSAELSRGRVDTTISVAAAAGSQDEVPVFNVKLARWYGARLAALARALKSAPPRAEAIAQLPGVFTRGEAVQGFAGAETLARQAMAGALAKLRAMRRREGVALGKDLVQRLAVVERLAGNLESEWPAAAARQRERTEAKLKAALERLTEAGSTASARDLVNSVERGDITEEITRLRSHVAQFREALAAGSPVGRKLDFLTQELHREVNTSGAKSTDTGLTRIVVELKEEVERIREQVQNIE